MNHPPTVPYTELDARRDAQDRANRDRADMRIYRGISLGCDQWYVRAAEAAPPHDVPLFAVITPETVCPNCGQWQHATNDDCVNDCRRRGLAK